MSVIHVFAPLRGTGLVGVLPVNGILLCHETPAIGPDDPECVTQEIEYDPSSPMELVVMTAHSDGTHMLIIGQRRHRFVNLQEFGDAAAAAGIRWSIGLSPTFNA